MKRLTTITALLALAAAAFAGEVTVKGSDTMLNLTQRLAEEFSAARRDVTVSIAGGGSGVGITAITNKEVQVANASRAIKSKEIATARANGVSPVEIAIAIDGLSVIVHSSNPVKQLTIDQLGAIYRGAVKNWNELGGPNRKINLYGRQPSSGTFVFFRDEVVKGEYATSMRQMNGSSQIVEGVKGDEGGIGYVGLGYVKEASGFKVLSLAKKAGETAISPLDDAAVKSGRYPLTRPLFQYTNGRPRGDARAFIEFELGPKGQEIVEAEGFLPVTSDYVAKNNTALGK
jgi:phosphate transport system substrate-binding protein